MTIKEFFQYYYNIVCHENLDLLDTIFHSDSPFLNGVKSQYQAVRKQVDMEIEIETLELVAKQDDLLVVRDKIIFEGKKEDKVNKSSSGNLHILTKKDEGEWKIHSTVCLAVSGV